MVLTGVCVCVYRQCRRMVSQ